MCFVRRDIFYGSEAADFEIDSEDDEEALEEEAEAMRLQAKMLGQVDTSDFGIDDVAVPARSAADDDKDATTAAPIRKDMSLASADDRLRQIAKDAPELLGLLSELERTIGQLRDKLQAQTQAVTRHHVCPNRPVIRF